MEPWRWPPFWGCGPNGSRPRRPLIPGAPSPCLLGMKPRRPPPAGAAHHPGEPGRSHRGPAVRSLPAAGRGRPPLPPGALRSRPAGPAAGGGGGGAAVLLHRSRRAAGPGASATGDLPGAVPQDRPGRPGAALHSPALAQRLRPPPGGPAGIPGHAPGRQKTRHPARLAHRAARAARKSDPLLQSRPSRPPVSSGRCWRR